MLSYGKTASNAIAAASWLARLEPGERAGSAEVARARGISAPLAAKILTVLSQAGVVDGAPGPGGGYRLRRPASEIRLADVVAPFEPAGDGDRCPFGPGWCGHGEPCPLHDRLAALQRQAEEFLEETTLAVFAVAPAGKGPSRSARSRPALAQGGRSSKPL